MTHGNIFLSVREIFTIAIDAAFPQIAGQFIADIATPKDMRFGDYQCNSAMRLCKQLHISPIKVAEQIVQAISAEQQKVFESIAIAPPGFINCFLSPLYISKTLSIIISIENCIQKEPSPQKIIIDFSSPNIAKEMHVGHLRSTIIGECLCRIFEAKGHHVLRLNHVGDWGTAFGMLIAHIKQQPGFSLESIKKYSLSDLMALYKESKKIFDDNSVFRKTAQREVVQLQSGNEESLQIWKIICDISETAYEEIYSLLDVTAIIRGESFYNPYLPKIVDEFEKKGLITISDGAKCVYVDGFKNKEGEPLPIILQKSDGGYNYDTTDMAALAHRIRTEKADRIIYVTDSGQSTHFAMLFAAAKKANILDETKTRVDHVPFGLVLGPDGKKFKTRSGETEKLIDLLTLAVKKAKAILDERNPSWDESEKETVATILGLGAIKYADLSGNRNSDYVFSYDRMLSFEGNTAAFILYAYVRTKSILRKVQKTSPPHFSLSHPSELHLAKTLARYPEIIDEICQTLLPNRLTDYLYALAEAFNGFFRDCHVENDPREDTRASLVLLTNKTLQSGLHLLGIKTLDRM